MAGITKFDADTGVAMVPLPEAAVDILRAEDVSERLGFMSVFSNTVGNFCEALMEAHQSDDRSNAVRELIDRMKTPV